MDFSSSQLPSSNYESTPPSSRLYPILPTYEPLIRAKNPTARYRELATIVLKIKAYIHALTGRCSTPGLCLPRRSFFSTEAGAAQAV